jgi:ABC-type transport system substrate-binding protein
MRRRVFRIAALVLAFVLVALVVARYARRLRAPHAAPAAAPLAPLSPVAPGTPTVYLGVYLRDVTQIDPKTATFDVDAEIWAKWRGTFDTDELRVANASAEATLQKIHESADGDWHVVSWRLRGPLRAELPLHDYPFDQQKLSIRFEVATRAAAIQPDLAASSIAPRFSLTGWDYTPRFTLHESERRYPSDLGRLENEGKPTTVRAIAFELPVHRPSVMAALKLFLPLSIILLVALVVFWVHPEELEVRAGIGVTALLTCFAFQFSVAESLPQVSYLTLTDRFFLGTYAVTVIALAFSVAVAYLVRRERDALALFADRAARVVFPVVIAALGVFWIRGVTRAKPIDAPSPVPHLGTPKSARDTLRIMTTMRPSLITSPLGDLVAGGLVIDRDDGDPLPLYVEEVPSVRTHGLELLPDGGMQMTWRIREKMRWSDGAPLEASDVCFAEKLLKPPHMTSCTTSGRDVVLRFDDRVVSALDEPAVLPAHVLSKLGLATYEAVRKYRRTHPIPGLGPYRVGSQVEGKSVSLEPNPSFPGSPPAIRRVELTFAKSPAEVVAAVEAGSVDVTPPNTVKPEGLRELRRKHVAGAFLRRGGVLLLLFPDYAVPLFHTIDGRRAVSAAIDRQAIATSTYEGDARPVTALAGDAPARPADPTALAALAKAHPDWAKAPLPVYTDKSGGPKVAEAVAAQLANAGFLGAHVVAVDSLTETRRKAHGGLVVIGMRAGKDASPLGPFNLPLVAGYYDRSARHVAYTDECAALNALMERSLYPERREQLRVRLEKLHDDLLPSIPVVVADERLYVDPALRDWDSKRFGAHLDRAWFAGTQ